MKLCGFLPAMTHDDNVQAAYQICRFHRGKSAFKCIIDYYQELDNLALRSHASLGGLPRGGWFSFSHETP